MTPLRLRMIENMRIRNLAPLTQTACVEHVSRFARRFGQSPENLGQDGIRVWQLHLVQEKQLAASSICVTVATLRCLYTVTLKRPWAVEDDIPISKQPKKLPIVLSPEEVASFLNVVKSLKHRLILTVCCAAGLRTRVAARPRSAVMSRAVTAAAVSVSPAIRAATGTVLNARISHAPNGCETATPNCSAWRISMSCSRCRTRSRRSRSRTRPWSMTSCSARRQKRCVSSPRTRNIWARRSGSSRSFTPGART